MRPAGIDQRVLASAVAWGTISGEMFNPDYLCSCNAIYVATDLISSGMNISVLIN